MWHFRGSKHTLTLLHIFRRSGPPNPQDLHPSKMSLSTWDKFLLAPPLQVTLSKCWQTAVCSIELSLLPSAEGSKCSMLPNMGYGVRAWWLAPLSAILFCMPATSAPAERMFSQGGIITRPCSTKMNCDLLEMRMNLRCNAN